MYIYPFSLKTPSHPGWHITLSRVPCAIQQVLSGCPFEIQQCVHDLPKALNYPFLLAPVSLFLKLVSLFLFCEAEYILCACQPFRVYLNKQKKVHRNLLFYIVVPVCCYSFFYCSLKQRIVSLHKTDCLPFSSFICVCTQSFQSCLTLCDPMHCSPPVSSVPEISQARTLEWVAIPSSRGSSPSWNLVSCIAGGFFAQ